MYLYIFSTYWLINGSREASCLMTTSVGLKILTITIKSDKLLSLKVEAKKRLSMETVGIFVAQARVTALIISQKF